MKKVLFIATEYPPLATTGVYRSLKFTKYLYQFEVDPIVATLTKESSFDIFGKIVDNSLLTEIPKSTVIHRIPCNSIKPYFSNKFKEFVNIYFSINDIIGRVWKKEFNIHIENIIETEKPTVIYTSLPPFSIGKLVTKIALKHRIPLIIDMRDGWLTWRTAPFGSYLHYLLTKREERYIFENADAVIGTTKELLEIFKYDHPMIDRNKFHWIPNGYDCSLIHKGLLLKKYNPKEKLKIGYVGSFYYSPKGQQDLNTPWWKKKGHKILQYIAVKEDWFYRSPYFFLLTIKRIIEKHPHLSSYIELHFVGKKPEWIDSMIQSIGINAAITFHGWLCQTDCRDLLSTFDAVFVTAAKRIGGVDWALPSKVFDYISAQKFIFAMVPSSATRNFILNTNTGVVLDPDNIDKAAIDLSNVILNGAKLSLNIDELQCYNRRNTAGKLSSIIYSL